jgi:hypothetical protein
VATEHKRVQFSKGTRVTLSEKDCAAPVGQELIALLMDIEDDGVLTPGEIGRLIAWLDKHVDSEIPAVQWLLLVAHRLVRGREHTPSAIYEMQAAIERALPKRYRVEVIEKRREAAKHQPASEAMLQHIRDLGGHPPPGLTNEQAYAMKEALWNQPTEPQLNYIRNLGMIPPSGLTKETASHLIDQLLHQRNGASPRQMMVLRFWNRLDLVHRSKAEVTEWMNEFYDEEPRRKLAWEMFKAEYGDDGSQHDPSWVPVGAGFTYLEKAPRLSRGSSGRRAQGSNGGLVIATAVVILIVIAAIFRALSR